MTSHPIDTRSCFILWVQEAILPLYIYSSLVGVRFKCVENFLFFFRSIDSIKEDAEERTLPVSAAGLVLD